MKQQTANFSNHIWQLGTVSLDSESSGIESGVILTAVWDVYLQCIAGYSSGSQNPKAAAIDALLHAIRPKISIAEYDLAREWTICGSPQFLMVDRSLSHDLEFVNALRRVPETSKISLLYPSTVLTSSSAERLMHCAPIRMLKFHPMPGVVDLSSSSEQSTCLTQKDIERLLVKYFVDEYNQSVHPYDSLKTRLQKWELGRPSSSESSLNQSDEACNQRHIAGDRTDFQIRGATHNSTQILGFSNSWRKSCLFSNSWREFSH
jgi:putative transposase